MCEFKIIRKKDGAQILEDIVILSYTEKNELLLKDILGMGDKFDSAMIRDVNTLTQKCIISEHPLIKGFISLLNNIESNTLTITEITQFQDKLETLKNELED